MITLDSIFKMVDEYVTGRYMFNTKIVQVKLNDVDSMQYFIENLTDINASDIDTYDGNIVTLKNDKYNFIVQLVSDDIDFYNHVIEFVKLSIN